MAGTFDYDLYVVAPCLLGEFAQHFKLKELRTVVGIVYRTRTHTVAQRHSHVIFVEYLAYLVDVSVK